MFRNVIDRWSNGSPLLPSDCGPRPEKFRICHAETLHRGTGGWILQVPATCQAPYPEYWCGTFTGALITMDGIIEAHIAAACAALEL